MWMWATKLLGLVPGLGAVLEKIGGKDNGEAEKLKAEAELADIKGFHKTGRISAKHFFRYTLSVCVFMLVIAFCISLFVPHAADNIGAMLAPLSDSISEIIKHW